MSIKYVLTESRPGMTCENIRSNIISNENCEKERSMRKRARDEHNDDAVENDKEKEVEGNAMITSVKPVTTESRPQEVGKLRMITLDNIKINMMRMGWKKMS